MMKSWYVRIRSTLTACALCCSMAVSAYAANEPAFRDVDADAPYASAVTQAYEAGRISGIGAGLFDPEAPLTAQAAAILLERYFPYSDVLDGYEGYVLRQCASDTPNAPVSWGYFLDLCFKADGVGLFQPVLYGGPENVSPGAAAVFAAQQMCLLPETITSDQHLKRGEAIYLMEQVLAGEYEQPLPALLSEFPVVLEDDSYRPKLGELFQVPKPILEKFKEQGWTLNYGTSVLTAYNEDHGTLGVGMTSLSDRAIYVADTGSLLHEFGHYLDTVIHITTDKASVFSAEKEAGATLLGTYAGSSSAEFFAESFDYWVRYADSELKINRMREIIPGTYQVMKELSEKGWC